MKKLSKAQQDEMQKHLTALYDKKEGIETAWAAFEGAHEQVVLAVDEYNGALSAALEWRDQMVADMQEYQSERSEKWQEGDAGSQYQSWIDEWENIDMSEVEAPELPEAPDFDHIESLENLPHDAESM